MPCDTNSSELNEMYFACEQFQATLCLPFPALVHEFVHFIGVRPIFWHPNEYHILIVSRVLNRFYGFLLELGRLCLYQLNYLWWATSVSSVTVKHFR